MSEQLCKGRVRAGRDRWHVYYKPCTKKAKAGSDYCGIHDPDRRAARLKANADQAAEEWRLEREQREREQRAINSHDALVEACAAVLPILPYWGVSSEALRARIADDGVEQWPHIERVLQLRTALRLARGGDA